MSTTDVREFLSVSEFARVVGVSADTARRWARSGTVQAVRLGGPRSDWHIARRELSRLADPASTAVDDG